MAPNERAKTKALAAYSRLHALCAQALAPDGIYCASSCSSHVTLEDFLATLANRHRSFRIAEIRGAGADHPTVGPFREGRYLKFCVAHAS
jgi:23S rRNA (cytosine1962-C5)-methyltransferase